MYGAIAAGIAILGFAFWRIQRPRIDELALVAYRDSRTLELRFSGAPYGPLQQQRGAAAERSPAWLDAESAIAHQTGAPSADLLQAKARMDLLAWRFEPAMETLHQALDLRPNSAPLWIDLACAHYERAEADSRNPDLGVAVELLSKALELKQDPAALFNRALVYERIGLVQQAIVDWKHYRELDSKSPWAAEAQSHLDALEKKKPPATGPSHNSR